MRYFLTFFFLFFWSPVWSQSIDGNPLKHGDLIFTRGANDIVPYRGEGAGAWRELQRDILAGEAAAAVSEIANWDHAHFLLHFNHGIDDLDAVANYASAGTVSVGHVAIFYKDEGASYVLEAAGPSLGVRTISWTDWLDENIERGNALWLARLRFDDAQINSFVQEALSHREKPYSLANRDLDDDREFYCSKLVWHAVKQATGVALDGNASGKRTLWFSPKKLLNNSQLKLVHSTIPESYSGLGR